MTSKPALKDTMSGIAVSKDHNDAEQGEGQLSMHRKRRANVYDAVAGRVGSHGFIPRTPYFSASRDISSTSHKAIAPDIVLSMRKNVPARYEENDWYFASDALQPDALPNPDLLKGLHTYASDLFTFALPQGSRKHYQRFDGTALLAFGILLEEMSRESLGSTGELALTEGVGVDAADFQTDPQGLDNSPERSATHEQEVQFSGHITGSRKRQKV